jgi:hypothetical protein
MDEADRPEAAPGALTAELLAGIAELRTLPLEGVPPAFVAADWP